MKFFLFLFLVIRIKPIKNRPKNLIQLRLIVNTKDNKKYNKRIRSVLLHLNKH